MKYFRYCTDAISPHTQMHYGIFVSVWFLVRDKKLTEVEVASYREAYEWYEEHLPIPPLYKSGNHEKAVTWFKESALQTEVVQKLDHYITLLKKYGVSVNIVTSDAPGRIIYEDEFQIATVKD